MKYHQLSIYKSPEEIEHDILQVLQEYFKLDKSLLNQKLLKTPLIKWNTVFKLNVACASYSVGITYAATS